VKSPLALVAAALFLCGCVPSPARVDEPRTDAPDKSYAVELPLGWIRQVDQNKYLVASRDGFPLNMIRIERAPLKKAFPLTKKAASESALPSELAELAVAEIRASESEVTAITVVSNEPASISGRDGFRVEVSWRNLRGLEIVAVVYGFADASGFYTLIYRAPRLHYFAKYLPEFERTVASFRRLESRKTAGT
jgi:hypothetical protein